MSDRNESMFVGGVFFVTTLFVGGLLALLFVHASSQCLRLTAEEREAIWCAIDSERDTDAGQRRMAPLRDLLDRTK